MNDYYFDEAEHKYYCDGIEIPSITDITSPIGLPKMARVQDWVLDAARFRGTMVHEACEEYMLTGELDFNQYPTQFWNYIEQFMNWVRTYQPQPLFTEHRMYCNEYAGTCDLICKLDGKTILVDYKTTSAIDKKSLSVQLEGYKRLCAKNNIAIDECWFLHLKKESFVFKPVVVNPEWFELLLKHNKFMRSKYNGK